jgi:hypothetical protein
VSLRQRRGDEAGHHPHVERGVRSASIRYTKGVWFSYAAISTFWQYEESQWTWSFFEIRDCSD